MRNFHQFIRAARERLKLSQSQFAGRFGIPVRTLQTWEQGKRQPTGLTDKMLRAWLKKLV